MSSNGTAPGPSNRDEPRENSAYRSSYSSSDNVLPPIAQSPRHRRMDGYFGPSSTQSSSQRIAETEESRPEQRGPRLLGVHSILNPTHGEEDERRSRRRVASEMDEPSRPTYTPPGSAAASSRPLSSNEVALAELSPPGQGAPRVIRRILTPISPRQRSTSFARLVPGTIDAQERPFLSASGNSRLNTPEHVTSTTIGMGHLASQTSHVAQQSPFIIPAAPTPDLHRRASVSVVGSTRPSPSPSYADSYGQQSGQSGQTSPAIRPNPGNSGPTAPGSFRLTPSPRLGPSNNVPPEYLDNEQGSNGNTVLSTGQNYQMLTVDTSKGHMQLPVEVQAASRMADEKRKRNAGASARFRARRKEKEREASNKISNLEHELLCAREDSRHYKAERDYLADVVARNIPQYESVLGNRPPSPRHNRMPHIPRPPMSIDSPISTTDRYDSPEADRPATRRRTEPFVSTNVPAQLSYPSSPYAPYTPNHGPPPPQQHLPAQQHSRPGQFSGVQQHPGPQQNPLQHPAQHSQQLPPQTQYAQQNGHNQELPPHVLSRPPPSGPSREQNGSSQRYDQRSWTPRGDPPPR